MSASPLAVARRLDEFLPTFHFNEVHATTVEASPPRVMRAIREVSPDEIRFFRGLMLVRGFGRRAGDRADVSRSLLDGALRRGFLVLAEDDCELVLGAVGRFWRLSGETIRLASAREFLDFDRPGCAKAAVDFRLDDAGSGRTRVTTETRILGTDTDGRRKFGRYWRVIHPGSAFIRRMWLAAIKKRAESDGREPPTR
jgi:hypothetical protein